MTRSRWVRLLGYFSVTALVTLGLPSTAHSQPRCAEKWAWTEDLQVAGHVGGRRVRGYFGDAYATAETNGMFGLFFFPARWTPGYRGTAAMFALDGTFGGDCSLVLTELDRNGEPHGTWQLRFVTSSRLEGRRRGRAGAPVTVSLSVVPAVDCSGKGPWRRFTSPRWPITFAYPVSWRLAETRDDAGEFSIGLVCPDPSSLVFGGWGIHLELNPRELTIPPDTGRSATSIGRFTTFDNKEWLIGECEDPKVQEPSGIFCAPVRASLWRGMTVLQGQAGEHRTYQFAGGYSGQGGGVVEYLFMMAGTRIRLFSEDSSLVDELGSKGPVIFKGDDVTARLVRSIRPK